MANNEHINKVVKSTGETLIDLTSDTVTAGTLLQDVTAHDRSGAQITGTFVPVTGVKGNDESSYRTGNVNLTPANIGAAPLTSSSTIDFVGEGLSLTKPGETNASFIVRTQTLSGVRENWLNVEAPNSSGARGVFFHVGNTATTIGVACQNAETFEDYGVHFNFDSDIFYGGVLKSSPPTHDDNHFKFNLDCVGDSIGRAANSGAALSGSTLDMWYETIRFNGKVMDMFAHSGQSHNAIWRGKYLGDTFTAEQKAAIANGTFEDMYVGDYWTINSVDWVIVDINYYYGHGDTACWTNHLVIVPRRALGSSQMNPTATTTGGYLNSAMRTTILKCDSTTASDTNTVYGKICAAFGESNILSHRLVLSNAIDANGNASSWNWTDSKVDLLNQSQIFGQKAWANGTNDGYNVGIQTSQLAAFRLNHNFIIIINPTTRISYWTSDVRTASSFIYVSGRGDAANNGANNSYGVRPHFCLMGG